MVFIQVGCQHCIYIYTVLYSETSPGVVLVVLVLVCVVLGVVVVVIEVAASRYCYDYHPQDYKHQYQDHQDHPGTRLRV